MKVLRFADLLLEGPLPLTARVVNDAKRGWITLGDIQRGSSKAPIFLTKHNAAAIHANFGFGVFV